MKIIKQLKKASMSNKKVKKNLSKKIDKKILKALKQRFRKVGKEMKQAENAYKMAKDFFDKNQSEKKAKKKGKADNAKSALKAKKANPPKTKKTATKKAATKKKPKSNARVTTLSQLEPTTPKKTIKRLPKSLRIKKSKATAKKRKTTLPKKVAVKKTILKITNPAPTKVTPVIKPVEKNPTPKPVAKLTTPTAKTTVQKTTPKIVASTPKLVAKKTPATRKPTITKIQMENLKIVEGVGPVIEKILKSKGINTVADLSKTRIGVLRNILEEAGSRFRMHKPDTWARQAKLAAAGKFTELKELQKELDGGKK